MFELQKNYYYVILREDYVLLFQRSASQRFEQGERTDAQKQEYANRRAHAVAKAYIIAVLEQLSEKQIEKGSSEEEVIVFLSFQQLEAHIHGGCKQSVLKAAMKELTEDGYVVKVPNPNSCYRALCYRINADLFRRELQALPNRDNQSKRVAKHAGIENKNLADVPAKNADVPAKSADIYVKSAYPHSRVIKVNVEEKERSVEEQISLPLVAPAQHLSHFFQPDVRSSDDSSSVSRKTAQKRQSCSSRSAQAARVPEIELSEEARAIYTAWCSLFKVAVPLTLAVAKAAEALTKPLAEWCPALKRTAAELLEEIRDWLYATDKKGYYKRGVRLSDVSREFEGWQSAMEREMCKKTHGSRIPTREEDPYSIAALFAEQNPEFDNLSRRGQ